jgi:2-oxoglutarate ferredoxin oxidoreductase subunit alpha
VNKVLMSGNNIIGEAAIEPDAVFMPVIRLLPQNELTEYMAEHMRNAEGGVFIQSESEIAAINMIAGASAAGVKSHDFIIQSRHFFKAGRYFFHGRL